MALIRHKAHKMSAGQVQKGFMPQVVKLWVVCECLKLAQEKGQDETRPRKWKSNLEQHAKGATRKTKGRRRHTHTVARMIHELMAAVKASVRLSFAFKDPKGLPPAAAYKLTCPQSVTLCTCMCECVCLCECLRVCVCCCPAECHELWRKQLQT